MRRAYKPLVTCAAAVEQRAVKPEGEVPGMSAYLDSLKWNSDGLVAVIAQVGWVLRRRSAMHAGRASNAGACRPRRSAALAPRCFGLCSILDAHRSALLAPPQHVDTGEVLMQAYADRNAICETLQTG